VAARLVERDPSLWLSKSWTTRARRPGESPDAYTFVDREAFEEHRAAGGFLESAEFLGHLYGTPMPDLSGDMDVVLEIDLQGAQQVRETHPEAVLVLLLPPSTAVQAERLRARGDDDTEVSMRLSRGVEEERIGRALTPYVVVNEDLDQAVAQVGGIVETHRRSLGGSPTGAEPVGDPCD